MYCASSFVNPVAFVSASSLPVPSSRISYLDEGSDLLYGVGTVGETSSRTPD